MRRRDQRRQPTSLFRGAELPRLLTMGVMLLVLAMMIRKASDTDTWRFLTGEPKDAREQADRAVVGKRESASQLAAEVSRADTDESAAPAVSEQSTPLDQDDDEQAAFAEEAQAISDKTPLAKEEMPTYWRLMRWEQSQSTQSLLARARDDVRIGELIERPEQFRGQLLKVRLHIARVLKFADLPDNPLGVKTEYQAVGWNDETQAWFYFCVFTDLPDGMPSGERVFEEGTFVGYFLKTLSYLDGSGKRVPAPVLIGKMVYYPAAVAKPDNHEWMWPWAVAGLLSALFAIRWGWRLLPRGNRPTQNARRPAGSYREQQGPASLDEWLDRAESHPTDLSTPPRASH